MDFNQIRKIISLLRYDFLFQTVQDLVAIFSRVYCFLIRFKIQFKVTAVLTKRWQFYVICCNMNFVFNERNYLLPTVNSKLSSLISCRLKSVPLSNRKSSRVTRILMCKYMH